MSQFEDSLQKISSPRLKRFGYQYNPNLRLGDELFGFSKNLGGEIYAVVQFQAHRGLSNDEFTINLLRVNATQLEPRSFDGYADALGARLTHVLWYVHQLRTYHASEFWWASADRSELEANLIDAANQIEQYGLTWIEANNPVEPWEMPEYNADQFVAALDQIVSPKLDRLGYQSDMQRLTGNFPYPYFVKSISDRHYAIIEFQQLYSLDPDRFIFDVRLQRKSTPDPLDFSGDYRAWQTASLGQLVWRVNGSNALPTSLTALQALLWHYTDRSELADRLTDALAELEKVGLPWLEHVVV